MSRYGSLININPPGSTVARTAASLNMHFK